MKKNYYNEGLEKMLNRYIKEEKYGGFKPLLNEIFQRRAYEFQFDDKHMKKEIKNFVRRTEKIGSGKNSPGLSENDYGGYFGVKGKGAIWFNCENNMFDTKNEYVGSEKWLVDIYQVLTHESLSWNFTQGFYICIT